MKKLLACLLLSSALLLSACEKFRAGGAKTIYISNPGSTTVTLKNSSDEDDDFDKITKLCTGQLKNGELDCTFGKTMIEFEYENEKIDIYPADNANYLAKGDIKGKTFDYIKLSDDEMKNIKDILSSYGIAVS